MATVGPDPLWVQLDGLSEAHRVEHWRVIQFIRIGFPTGAAEALAKAKVDTETARQLVQRGCPFHLAERILLD